MKQRYALVFLLFFPFASMADWDAAVTNKESSAPTLQVNSVHSANEVVACILAKYKSKDIFVDGMLSVDFSIILQLFAPSEVTLGVVRDIPGGSVTQYINVKNKNNKTIPREDVFVAAVNSCQNLQ